MHEWYFRTVVEYVAKDLKNTDAFREFTERIDRLWGDPYSMQQAGGMMYFQVGKHKSRVED